MRIQLLIATTLAALTGACPSTWNCDPDSETFEVDAALSEADIATIINDYGYADRSEIICETACEFAYGREKGWTVQTQSACTYSIAPNPGATPEAEVGSVQCEGDGLEYFCEGRRPLGHVPLHCTGNSLADFLGRSAHLEEASIVAFEQIAEVLAAAEAPAILIQRCRWAADDERRHASLARVLARRHGAKLRDPQQRPITPTLTSIALDNAREGCVLETWSALRAAWLAEHAKDPEIRRLYASLADDESEHAQLSWDLHNWLQGQVDQTTAATAKKTLQAALQTLPALAQLQAEQSPQGLGMCPTTARRLAEHFAEGLANAA
ncbi:MAG TPA: hypothetical protein ENK31_01450 [Nannocystis exedens]|nr:hypothetical protein [Nannocystis exedens]